MIQGSTSQQKLCKANVAVRIVAFACGKDDEDNNKKFEGGRPSSIIIGEKLTPAALGALLSHFENKVMFQGLCGIAIVLTRRRTVWKSFGET